jgi:pyruvate/2-oxoglutarate/acetoin dehydrogenase E1 component
LSLRQAARRVKMRKITFLEAVREAIDEEMAKDPDVILLGTDVGPIGGSMGELVGIYEKYGSERVRETPISETAIVGCAIGAAAGGMRPIAEVSFADFLYIPMSEIVNQLTTMRWMHRGRVSMPVTIRSMTGGGLTAGFQHSKCHEGMFASIPGLKIVLPSTPFDCKGILKAAIRDDNPVLFLQHRKFLVSPERGPVPEEDYTVPIGKADIKKEGTDVTVVATMLMVHRALAAARRLEDRGISIEVIDPRTLVPLDRQTIIDSVRKTNRLVIMTEECRTGSSASDIAAMVADEAFDYLDAPIKRVNSLDAPIPYGPTMEAFFMPDEDDLIKVVTEVM